MPTSPWLDDRVPHLHAGKGALVDGEPKEHVVGIPANDRGGPQGVFRRLLGDLQLGLQLLVLLHGVLIVHQLFPQLGVLLGKAVHHVLQLVPGEGVQVHKLGDRAGGLGAHALHGGGGKAQQACHQRPPCRGGVDNQPQKHHHHNGQHFKGTGFKKVLQDKALLLGIFHEKPNADCQEPLAVPISLPAFSSRGKPRAYSAAGRPLPRPGSPYFLRPR